MAEHRIESRLKELLGDSLFLKLKEKMSTNGAIISGSMILQCILNTRWSGSDIDIYVPDDHLTAEGYPTTIIDTLLYNEGVKPIGHDHPFHYESIPSVIGWRDMSYLRHWRTASGCNVQTITLDITGDQMIKYICASFDFSICMNVFGYHKNGEPWLYVHDPDGIQYRRFTWQHRGDYLSSVMRGLKYHNRGFCVVGFPSPEDIKRMQREQHRGTDISFGCPRSDMYATYNWKDADDKHTDKYKIKVPTAIHDYEDAARAIQQYWKSAIFNPRTTVGRNMIMKGWS